MLAKVWRKGDSLVLLSICKLTQPLWKTIPEKFKTRTTDDPAIPVLGVYPKETKTLSQKNICISLLIAALFSIAKIGKQSRCHQLMNGKENCGVYTYIYKPNNYI